MKIHAEEMSESETAFMLEQGKVGLRRIGDQLGPLAGWLKDIIDQEFGPDWQVIVGRKGSFGSCLSPIRLLTMTSKTCQNLSKLLKTCQTLGKL